MKHIVVAIPHSHTWFWVQTCIASLRRNPPTADGYDVSIIVVDNSPWSPAIRGIVDTPLSDGIFVIPNHKTNAFHASALDCVVEDYEFDYLMAMETDVLALRPNWLQWFLDQMRPTDFAVGMWHHEQFVNPSCTLYRGEALRDMLTWCRHHPSPNTLRWGPLFGKSVPLDPNLNESLTGNQQLADMKGWIAGPFAEKRGWPAGHACREEPSGQRKGPGWYEPGQQLHHWATDAGWTYTVCPTSTTYSQPGLPVQTFYGTCAALRDPAPPRQLEANEMFGNAETVHLWGGTRALDVIKHDVTCQFVKANTPGWLAREARFWRAVVPVDVQAQTLDLIRQYGWHYRGQGTPDVTARDRAAVTFVKEYYEASGVTW